TTYDARRRPPKAEKRNPVVLAKVPPVPRKQISDLEREHGITGFKAALKTFLQKWHGVSYRFYDGELPSSAASTLTLIKEVAVWYNVKFYTPNLQSLHAPDYHDIAHCTPQRTTNSCRGRIVWGDLEVARLRAIFKIPPSFAGGLFGTAREPPAHLGLVEWFSRPTRRDPDSALYKISREFTSEKQVKLGVIEILDIRRSCQLFPRFGPEPVDRKLTTHTVLDAFNDFLLNDCLLGV
ncbi:hypothetical protein AURDEDRAFT_163383, partial [Auricularia subglabra TFB-10046 SS5]